VAEDHAQVQKLSLSSAGSGLTIAISIQLSRTGEGPMATPNDQDHRAELLRGAPVTGRTIDVGGISTPLLEAGAGPPVVVLHGQGTFAAALLPLVVPLSEGHRVIAPDLPGLGASHAPEGVLDQAEPTVMHWLAELIEQTCDAPPALVGMSLGGSVAARFAARHGDLISQLVLMNAGSLGRRPPLRVLLPLIRHSARPSEKTAQRMASIVMLHPERAADAFGTSHAAFNAYMLDRARTPSVQQANRRLLRQIGMPQLSDEQLRDIGVPTTVIVGRQDRVMDPAHAEAASRRHGWSLTVIDDAGHVVFVDQPDATIRALREAISAGAA
jgi:pimeloyl-ACP methyl ester carboxylesterase